MATVVIFDVGKTLIKCTHKDIIKFLYRKNKVSLYFLIKIFMQFLLHRINFINDKDVNKMTRKAFRIVLRGWDVYETEKILEECFEEVIKPKIIPESIALIQEHTKREHTVILISALIGGVIEKLKEYLGLEYAIYPNLEVQNGKYTGEILGCIPYGEDKANIIKQIAEENHFNLEESWAYADRFSDIPLLKITKHPCVVNPDRKLRKFAQRKGWRVYDFK
ncbi:MAG: HAD-IB family hydrolase [Candidatus Omnitrophica bacterium]|nr:HAD-IB family hydrolase [Candidatus Omnitrophota bacterium]